MDTTEKRFESDIEAALLSPAGGYTKGTDVYDPSLALYARTLVDFIRRHGLDQIMQGLHLEAGNGKFRAHADENQRSPRVHRPHFSRQIDAQRSADVVVEKNQAVFAGGKSAQKILPGGKTCNVGLFFFLLAFRFQNLPQSGHIHFVVLDDSDVHGRTSFLVFWGKCGYNLYCLPFGGERMKFYALRPTWTRRREIMNQ